MQLHDVHLLEVVNLRPDLGLITLRDQRVFFQSAAALGQLRSELIREVGIDRARCLLLRFGYAQGYLDALCVAGQLEHMPPEDRVLYGATLHTLQGLAKVHPLRIAAGEHSTENEHELENCWEAEHHQHAFGQSSRPVCWTLTGYAAGFGAGVFGTEVYFREVACQAMGAPRCRILGRDAARWGDERAGLEAEYQGPGDPPLAAVRDDVRRAYEARRAQAPGSARPASVVRIGPEGDDVARRHSFIVASEKMTALLGRAELVAPLATTVLVSGESGTGKEFLARFLHERSPRAARPFVAVNCAALAENLLESELFGHEKGSFSGAHRDKVGLFEHAGEGTLFLDEIGEVPLAVQAKLLRALESREFRRVGSERILHLRARVVAATNRDLRQAVASGGFREDLYYRLSAFVLSIPPLRERREEIPVLAHYFMHAAAATLGKAVHTVHAEAMGRLMKCDWPGNVRQLLHAVEQATIVCAGPEIAVGDLPAELMEARAGGAAPTFDLKANERELVEEALRRFGGSRAATAAALNISPVTLWRRMKRYGLL